MTKTLATIPRNVADFKKKEILVITKIFSILKKKKKNLLKKPCINHNLSLWHLIP